jgi:hypothetical protein
MPALQPIFTRSTVLYPVNTAVAVIAAATAAAAAAGAAI